MKVATWLILCLLIYCSCLGQNRELHGVVLFLNSHKTPGVNVKISGQGANSVYSTESGQFVLLFPNKEPGEPAGLSVGPRDKNNTPLELVNSEIVTNARIPNLRTDQTYVIVCKAGQLMDAKQHYYNVCDSVLRAKYDLLIASKNHLIEDSRISELQKATLRSEIDSLRSNLKESRKKNDELAGYIASINQDFANDLVKSAIEKIDKQKDIEGALQILSDQKLDELFQAAFIKRQNADEEIKNIVEGYVLKAKILGTQFKYRGVIDCYEKIVAIYQKINVDDDQAKLYKFELASSYFDIGENRKAVDMRLALKTNFEKHPNDVTGSGGAIYISNVVMIARTYIKLDLLDSALIYTDKALTFGKVLLVSKQPEYISLHYLLLSNTYYDMARAYRAQDKLDKALKANKDAISTTEDRLGKNYTELGLFYNDMATTYLSMKQSQKALECVRHALSVLEKESPPNYINLGEAYENLSLIKRVNKEIDSSYYFIDKAMKVYQSGLQSDDYAIGLLYYRQGLYYKLDGDEKNAIISYKKAANISLANHRQSEYLKLITEYYEMNADTCRDARKYKTAISYLDSAYTISKDLSYLNDIGICYDYLNDYPRAIEYYEKVLAFDGAKTVEYIYNNIGFAYAKSRLLEKAYKAFMAFEAQHIDTAIVYRNWTLYYAISKNKEKAITNLIDAVSHGYKNLEWITTDADLEILRSDDRYKQLVTKLKANAK